MQGQVSACRRTAQRPRRGGQVTGWGHLALSGSDPTRRDQYPPQTHPVSVGDRIAQLVLERIATPEVEEVASLDDTERGAGGFGSTGVAAAP